MENQGKVNVLLEGAQDYLTKPFDTKELFARIMVQLRNRSAKAKWQNLEFQDIELDSVLHQAGIDDNIV